MNTRTKAEKQILSYNCLTVPDLDIELLGSYADGCIPRYEVLKTTLLLVFDTESCQEDQMDNTGIVIGMIAGIIAILIVITITLVIVLSNDNIRSAIFNSKHEDQSSTEALQDINNKMSQVDAKIEEVNNKVTQLNDMLDA